LENAFTVDVEEWFHICGVGGNFGEESWTKLPSRVVETTKRLLDLLDGRHVQATFFVLGWVADRYPHLVSCIRSAGHEVASHGYSHRRVYELGPEAFEKDLDRSLAALSRAGVDPVLGYRAPEWSINDRSLWALEILARRGFLFDSSMTPLRLIGNPSYSEIPHSKITPSGEIVEFPPLVGRHLGQNYPLGGGWGLRMHSPRTVLRRIEERNNIGLPVALFVHPWELDPDPPRVRLPVGHRFAHYFRLDGFAERLDEILAGVAFAPMSAVLRLERPVA
jgi:polysaccharide deacetylase family protein (PEP-CTERM system associated)